MDHPTFRFTREPSPEVLAYFRNKGLAVGFDWRDVWPDEHAHAFTVAKATSLEVLRTIRAEVDRAIAAGLTFEEFQTALEPRLKKLGWWGKQAVTDPETGETVMAQLGSPHRLRIIFEANIRSAFAAGAWERIERAKDVLPFLIYQETTSREPRDEHLEWAHQPVVLPVDDPWWDTHFPPNGWQCKCWVLQVDETDARAAGWTPQTKAPDLDLVDWYNSRTNTTEQVPAGIDPGWAQNPGRMRRQLLDAYLSGKLDDVEPVLKSVLLADITSSWLFRQIAEGKITAKPNATPLFGTWSGGPLPNVDVRAPAGHLDTGVQAKLGWKSGVVWLDPMSADVIRTVHPKGAPPLDWANVPRVLDGGAVVRSAASKDWLTVYRNVDGALWRADVSLRTHLQDGTKIKGGPVLRLEGFSRVEGVHNQVVAHEIKTAAGEGRLLRAEQTGTAPGTPHSLSAAAAPKGGKKPAGIEPMAVPPRPAATPAGPVLREGGEIIPAKKLPADGLALVAPDASRTIEAWKNVSRLHQHHLKTYTYYDSRWINRYLRTGEVTEIVSGKLVPVAPEKATSRRLEIEAVSRHVQEAIHANVLPDKLLLYRGSGIESLPKGVLTEGFVWREAAFTSTSRELAQAQPFHDHAIKSGRQAVVMVVDAGRHRGMSVEGVSRFGYEREFVLPAGTAFRVVKVEKDVRRGLLDKPRTYVHVEIVDQPPSLADRATPVASLSQPGAAGGGRGLSVKIRGDRQPRSPKAAYEHAANTVTENGAATGCEWGCAYDAAGRHLATWTSGKPSALAIDPALTPELFTRRSKVSLHHNHPGSTSFSDADLAAFDALPGLSDLYAHGRDGSVYRAHAAARGEMAARVAAVDAAARRAVRAAVAAGIVSHADAELLPHLTAQALHRTGAIRYESRPGRTMAPVHDRNADAIERLTERIVDAVTLLPH